jgi:hypothetical protein
MATKHISIKPEARRERNGGGRALSVYEANVVMRRSMMCIRR